MLEGSVRKGGDRVRITAQLNDVATGSHLWAERYDRDLADVFAVQDEITEAIVAAIEPQLYAAENFRAQRKPPDSMDAWDLVMRALSHYWRVTRQDNVVAQALLEKAIAIDPNYGQALGVLADQLHVHRAHGLGGHGDGGADRRARGAGGDPRRQRGPLGAPRARLRLSVRAPLRRLAGRIRAGAAAQSELLAGAGLLRRCRCAYSGRWQEADEAARRALRLSPRDPFSAVYYGIAAYAQFLGRNYDEAMRLAREALRQRSDFVGAHRVLTAAAGMAGTGRRRQGRACRSCAARSPISRSPGSPATCRSSRTPTASTIWKASAAPGWTDVRRNSAKSFAERLRNMCRIAPCSTAATWSPFSSPPSSRRVMKVEPAWIDYNGHLNMAYYNVLFDRAVDEVFELLGCGADYVKKGFSTFTAEVHVRYLRELKEGDPVRVTFQLLDYDAKRMHYFEQLFHAEEGWVSATSENMSLHVDMAAKKTAPFPTEVTRRLIQMKASHGQLPRPEAAGRSVAMPGRS